MKAILDHWVGNRSEDTEHTIVSTGELLALLKRLGTNHHTLLSLEALRRRAIPVLGVVMSGPLSAGNREAIERFGNVRVLAEIPPLDRVDAAAVEALARTIAPLDECLAALNDPA